MVVLPLSAASELRAIERLNRASAVGVDKVSRVAVLADTDVTVKCLTLRVNFAANSVVVEDVALRALGTVSVNPGLAPEIVVDRPQKFRVLVFLSKRSLSFRTEHQVQVDYLGASHCQQHQANQDHAGFCH